MDDEKEIIFRNESEFNEIWSIFEFLANDY